MPTNTLISNTTDLTLDLSIKSLSKRSMSTIKVTTTTTDMSDSGDGNIITDNDEIKIFECEKHDEDNNDRLSPVIKEESSLQIHTDHSNSEQQQQFQNFFPYFISPYYQTNNNIQTFEKIPSLESLSKFISPPPPPPAHISNSNINMDQNPGIYSLPSSYSPHWRSSMLPFIFPSGYTFSSNSSSPINSKDFINDNNFSKKYKQHISPNEHKQKKSHIKKPLNAFMLFMKEQRSQVVQECTLRESAAINQILGRKWHELDRNVQQKYYDMARDERMKHMQLYPGWSARDNYGARKKRPTKGKKRDKNQECLNQKKCRARFGLEQQANWCKHCKRKKKCLRYTENETTSISVTSWSDEDDTDNIDDSDDGDIIPMIEPIHKGISMDSDEENKLRLLKYQQNQSFYNYSFLPKTTMTSLNEFKREI